MDSPCEVPSDFELIRRMADQANRYEESREAWGELYTRHQPFLLRVCAADYGYIFDAKLRKDLVDETFMKAFHRSATFRYDEGCDCAEQKRRFRGWLARILENLVRDRFRGQEEVPIIDIEDIERVGEPPLEDVQEDPGTESQRLRLLRCGLDTLSEIEQTVLRATIAWWRPGTQQQRMPNAAMRLLAADLNKSAATIRQIRHRAMQKLVKFIQVGLGNE